ncbi:MAG TPA: hypothetical protein VEC13_01050, partial [Candidatus Paceibacterota bacterium]|nr:hypothetical protein [Candidatus Paceibacterota bacterium]
MELSEIELNKKENIPEHSFYDFFNLSEEQFIQLKQKVAEWNGLIRLFVHPTESVEYTDRKKIIDLFFNLIHRSKDKTPPVVVFEETGEWSDLLKEIIDEQVPKEDSNLPYMIETIERHPFPVDEEYPELTHKRGSLAVPGTSNFDRERDYLVKVMANLASHFMALGVKKILIGGNNLVYSEKNQRFEQ